MSSDPRTPAIAAFDRAPARTNGAGKSFAIGAVAVTAALGAVLASGVLDAHDRTFAAIGGGTALAAGALVALLQPRLLRAVDASRLPGMQLQVALGLAFVVKLFALALGVLFLVGASVKFSGVAAFAVSFAGASLVLQVCSAAVSAKAPARAAAGPTRIDPLH